MKSLAFILFLSFFLSTNVSAASGPERPWSALENSTLPEIHVPPIQRQTLKNGMQLLLLEDRELPVVRGYLYWRVGGLYEPADKLGLAEMTGELLREGGTAKRKPEDFEAELAAIGADIESDISRESGLIGFRCLKEDLPKVLGLLFEMLREPAFDAKKLELVRTRMLEALRRQNDDPGKLAMREFPKLIYGPENVWSRTATPATLKAITREDVEAFYRRFAFPDRMILALSGDFDPKAAAATVEKDSRGWAKADQPLPEVPKLSKTWQPGLTLIPKATDQATLILGHYGDQRFNPDKFALLLLNDILGGEALVSRLGKRVRSTLGLAYGIYSRYGLETDLGVFMVMAQTKGPSTRQVLAESRKILEEIRRPGSISEAELAFYKQSLLNSLYSEYEPRYNFAKDEARFTFYGYPPNYLELFRENIEKVTLADIHRVAEKYLKPEALQVLVVGDPKQIGPL
ncbi:MAG TPA: pitrilysin family protein, partial [bacterium]|nr:pitrilysin family protein [bacterium]